MSRMLSNVVWWLVAAWIGGYAAIGPHTGKSLNSPITFAEVIAFLVVFGLYAGLGKLTAHIASRTGGNYVKWSYYGLLLPYVALPHALLKLWRIPLPFWLVLLVAIGLVVLAVSFAPQAWNWLTSSEDLGTRLRRECETVVRETKPQYANNEQMREIYVRQCIDARSRLVR